MQAKTTDWNDLSMLDRKIIISLCFDDEARNRFRLSHGHWRHIEKVIKHEAVIKFQESLRRLVRNSAIVASPHLV